MFSASTVKRSHDASLSLCRQLPADIQQARYTIGSWGDQISDSDCLGESAPHFAQFLGICVHIQSGDDGENGNGDDGNGDAVGDGDHSTRST